MLGSRGVSLIFNASGRRSRWRARRGKRGAVWPSVAFPSGRCRLLPSGPRVKLAAGVRSGRRRGRRWSRDAARRRTSAVLSCAVLGAAVTDPRWLQDVLSEALWVRHIYVHLCLKAP